MDRPTDELMSMFVLEVLHDCEPVPSILDLLNDDEIGWRDYWARDFTEAEVLRSLGQLLDRGLVRILDERPEQKTFVPVERTPDLDLGAHSYWFARTELGQKIRDEWEPPELD